MPNEWEKGQDDLQRRINDMLREMFGGPAGEALPRISEKAACSGPGFLYRDGPVIGLDASMALLASVYGCPVELVDDVLRVGGL